MGKKYPLAPPWIDETLKESPITQAANSLPTWMRDTDIIVRRGSRYFVVSLHESEPRWRRLWRRLKTHFNERQSPL